MKRTLPVKVSGLAFVLGQHVEQLPELEGAIKILLGIDRTGEVCVSTAELLSVLGEHAYIPEIRDLFDSLKAGSAVMPKVHFIGLDVGRRQ